MGEERRLLYFERQDKKLEIALNFIEELRVQAIRQRKKQFADRVEFVLSQIKSI